MNSETGTVLVISTAPNPEEANQTATVIVERKLAACCNIVPGIRSVYMWEKKINIDDEVLLIIKTAENKVKQLIKQINDIHSYEVPEVIVLPIIDGIEEYLNWVKDSTKGG